MSLICSVPHKNSCLAFEHTPITTNTAICATQKRGSMLENIKKPHYSSLFGAAASDLKKANVSSSRRQKETDKKPGGK